MDFGLKEIGLTLLIGAFTISGFELILRYVFNKSAIGFLENNMRFIPGAKAPPNESAGTRNDEKTMSALVFLGFSFLFGLLAEDISYKYEDSVQMPFKSIPAMTVKLLSQSVREQMGFEHILSRFDSRISTLVGNLAETPKITPLAKELAQSEAFRKVDQDKGKKVEAWIKKPTNLMADSTSDGELSQKDVAASITGLYYLAKNQVYGNANYYDEMKRIQSRLEFSRSISMIAFLYLLFGLALSSVSLIYKVLAPIFYNRKKAIDKSILKT